MDILNTHRFKANELGVDSVMLAATRVEPEPEPEPACCVKSVSEGQKKCCKKKLKKENLIDSGLSQVLLGVVPNNKQFTRHEKRFGITSFVYRSRRPFHPGRLHDMIMDPYFMCSETSEVEPEELEELQMQAVLKQKKRVQFMGELLRSKGFLWVASTNWIMGGWQQAGNILRIAAEGPWMCESREFWEGTPSEEEILKDMTDEDGEEFPLGDRRQELVFIGVGLKHGPIQHTLDECLLDDDEMEMSPDKWEQEMADEDQIKLSLREELSLSPGQACEEFWGITLSEELKDYMWVPPASKDEEDDIEYQIRVTQACLGRRPKEGERNLVEVTTKDNDKKMTTSIAALRVGPVESIHLDLVFTDAVQFTLAEGSGPVSLSGIFVMSKPESEEEGGVAWEDVEELLENDEQISEVMKGMKLSRKNKRTVKEG